MHWYKELQKNIPMPNTMKTKSERKHWNRLETKQKQSTTTKNDYLGIAYDDSYCLFMKIDKINHK